MSKTTKEECDEARKHYKDDGFFYPAEQEFIGRLLDDADRLRELEGAQTELMSLDLSACTDPTVPACPGCETNNTVMMETTAGNWQLFCLDCKKRWGSDWKPGTEDDHGRR